MWYSTYTMKEINAPEAKNMIAAGAVTPIDVRTADEYSAGHIKGCLHVDIGAADFSSRIAALAKDQAYLMYCGSGGRSSRAAQIMTQMGFTDVTNLSGGITAWKKVGLPVEK